MTQAFDLAPTGYLNYAGANSLTIYNNSVGTVQLDNFEIIRTYKVTALNDNSACSGYVNTGSTGLDSTRVDYPCTGVAGGARSYAEYYDTAFANMILKSGDCFQWNWDWTKHTGSSYQGPEVCFFNFNQIWQNSITTSPTYLEAYLNGNLVQQYYISEGVEHGSFPSVEIMHAFSAYYNDTGANTMELYNGGPSSIQMSSDGINIYRIYKTSAV